MSADEAQTPTPTELAWRRLSSEDHSFTDGVAIWLLRCTVGLDRELTIADVQSEAIRAALLIDLVLAGYADTDGSCPDPDVTTGFEPADQAIRSVHETHQGVEHWLRLGKPHAHVLADVLVAGGEWDRLPHLGYHRYRALQVMDPVGQRLLVAYDNPDGVPTSVAALTTLMSALRLLGPSRRTASPELLARCAPADELLRYLAGCVDAVLSDIGALAITSRTAMIFGGGVLPNV